MGWVRCTDEEAHLPGEKTRAKRGRAIGLSRAPQWTHLGRMGAEQRCWQPTLASKPPLTEEMQQFRQLQQGRQKQGPTPASPCLLLTPISLHRLSQVPAPSSRELAQATVPCDDQAVVSLDTQMLTFHPDLSGTLFKGKGLTCFEPAE